jgi:predicted nucleic acid-binding protein
VIFVDTSFWSALFMRRDALHRTATELLASHAGTPLITTNMVRGETWTLLRSRDSHRVAAAFLDRIARTPRVEMVAIEPEIEEHALDWLRRHDERSYSFVDATSFALMRKKRVSSALAFDADFSAAGFVELRL